MNSQEENDDDEFIKNMVSEEKTDKSIFIGTLDTESFSKTQKKKLGRPKKNNGETTEVDDKDVFVDENEIKCSSPNDKNWTEFVLSKLRKGESDQKGNPTTNGLRRLVEELIGPIIYTDV